jgi:hypothetical protein
MGGSLGSDERKLTLPMFCRRFKEITSAPAIAHRLSVSVRTVQRYLRHEQFPERQSRSDLGESPTLEPYKQELLE